jgi:5-methylcytosine-specific restriction endonuclease McrA
MGMNDKPSRAVTRTRRWAALRMQALRRDGWRCVRCGARGRLEVDHVQPVANRPDLSWDVENLQTLCNVCHAYKTQAERGATQLDEEKSRWRRAVRSLASGRQMR